MACMSLSSVVAVEVELEVVTASEMLGELDKGLRLTISETSSSTKIYYD